MYLNFSNFRGRTLAGGDKPWSKNGDKCQMGGGGFAKFSPAGGTPQSPPGKKSWVGWFDPVMNYSSWRSLAREYLERTWSSQSRVLFGQSICSWVFQAFCSLLLVFACSNSNHATLPEWLFVRSKLFAFKLNLCFNSKVKVLSVDVYKVWYVDNNGYNVYYYV